MESFHTYSYIEANPKFSDAWILVCTRLDNNKRRKGAKNAQTNSAHKISDFFTSSSECMNAPKPKYEIEHTIRSPCWIDVWRRRRRSFFYKNTHTFRFIRRKMFFSAENPLCIGSKEETFARLCHTRANIAHTHIYTYTHAKINVSIWYFIVSESYGIPKKLQ